MQLIQGDDDYLSQYWSHVSNWEHCERCPLHERRHQVVLWRGYLPCELLLIGEAPGRVENAQGEPFAGDAGWYFDYIIKTTQELLSQDGLKFCTWAVTNIVGCFPYKSEESYEFRAPNDEETKACKPRLEEFIDLAQPKLAVRLGQVAKKYFKSDILQDRSIPVLDLLHPSAIQRTEEQIRTPLLLETVTELYDFIKRNQ